MRLLSSLLFLTLFGINSYAQKGNSPEIIDTLNKRIPSDLVEIVLKTLKHYPELDDISIDFVFDNGMHNSFMQAKPRPMTLLKGHKKRVYKIQMMSAMMINDTIIPIHQLPEKALMGWVGHEIAHIVDYNEMNTLDIVLFSINYLLSKNFIIKTEARVDIIAIEHQLGDEIIAMKEYILNHYSLPEAYRAKIRNIYLSPDEVRELMTEVDFQP